MVINISLSNDIVDFLFLNRYNANLDDPYPRSPDKKRFITEGNITAQQCRSWFANRRQRLKHVKKNLSKSSSSRSHPYLPAKYHHHLSLSLSLSHFLF